MLRKQHGPGYIFYPQEIIYATPNRLRQHQFPINLFVLIISQNLMLKLVIILNVINTTNKILLFSESG